MSDWPPCPVGNDNFGSHIPTIYPLIYIYIYNTYTHYIIYPSYTHYLSILILPFDVPFDIPHVKNSHDSPTRWSTMGAWSSQGTAQGYRISFETWPTFPWKARRFRTMAGRCEKSDGWRWRIYDVLWIDIRYGEGFGIFVFKIFIQIVLLLSFICWSLS